ncbi:MAG TPA: transposase [Phycisphaerae bacterium]|nr:transposase [Phycisphaerae bacterium]
MTREARAVVVGVPHHITQRGNNRRDVFFVDDDRHRYLGMLQAKAEQYGLTIHAYCLMTNHVHIVATPEREDSLAKGIGRAHYFYTRYVNKLHGRSGHLWQNRYFSSPPDESYFMNTVR